jgi:hypothetical protein
VLLAGCPAKKTTTNSGGDTNGKNAKPPVEPQGPRTYALADLKVGLKASAGALDDGRIEVAGPEGWTAGDSQPGYVAWFHRDPDPKKLPQIRVLAEFTPAEAPADVTPENVEEFADWLAGHVKKDLKSEQELLEPVIPMILGDNAFGRYVRMGRLRGADVEQHFLVTARGERLYTIQQLVAKGTLQDKMIRDAAYAVAAGMKFPLAAGTPADPTGDPASDPPPDAAPATP